MPTALLERHAHEHLVARLVTRYAGRYNQDQVAEAVAEAYARFADARVRTFVPLLAERVVREELEQPAGRRPRRRGR